MKRILSFVAALVLLATGYALGVSSTMTGQAGPLMQGGCQTFTETGNTVCGKFLQYWQEHGGLPQQGFPISPEIQEKSDLDGKTYTVQYFERAVFESHPENQPPYDVLLSQLGTFRYREKYQSGGTGNGNGGSNQQPANVELGDPVERNGLVFTVIRLDRLEKRIDVAYKVKNQSGGPVTFVLANKDQRLYNDANRALELVNPAGVTTMTLQNGQEFTSGTSWHGTLPVDADDARYEADNITGIGSVRVHIPLSETE